jgi:hypothetical protein
MSNFNDAKNFDERRDAEDDVQHSRADDEFGGPVERARMEKRLLRRYVLKVSEVPRSTHGRVLSLDLRHSILIVIYILNYVRPYSCHVTLSNSRDLQIDRNNASLVVNYA